MAKILVVTKDIAEFLVFHPVVALLREAGHEALVLAEGLSLSRWLEAGEQVLCGKPPEEKVDRNGCRYDVAAESFLRTLQPDMVLTGLGAPINLGQSFGLAANALGITLGYVVDIWGAHIRSLAVPDFVCTLDLFQKELIESYGPYHGALPAVAVYITGSPAMDRLAAMRVQEDPLLSFLEHVSRPVVFFAGQDESTTPALEIVVDGLNALKDGYILIPRFHPKFASRLELVSEWEAALRRAEGVVLRMPARFRSEELAAVSDYVVSVYSSVLLEAALLGVLPVSIPSRLGRQKMREAIGFERFPLVEYGCAIEVFSADELGKLVGTEAGRSSGRAAIERCRKFFPKTKGAALAVRDAILEQLLR